MKTRLKILFRALIEKNVILIYSFREDDLLKAEVITDTKFTKEEDSTILMSASANLK